MKYAKRFFSLIMAVIVFIAWMPISCVYALLISPFVGISLYVFNYVKDGMRDKDGIDKTVNKSLDFMFEKPIDVCDNILDWGRK